MAALRSIATAMRSMAAALRSVSAALRSTAAALRSTAAALRSTAAALRSVAVPLRHTAAALRSVAAARRSIAAAMRSMAAALRSVAAALRSTAAALRSMAAAMRSVAAGTILEYIAELGAGLSVLLGLVGARLLLLDRIVVVGFVVGAVCGGRRNPVFDDLEFHTHHPTDVPNPGPEYLHSQSLKLEKIKVSIRGALAAREQIYLSMIGNTVKVRGRHQTQRSLEGRHNARIHLQVTIDAIETIAGTHRSPAPKELVSRSSDRAVTRHSPSCLKQRWAGFLKRRVTHSIHHSRAGYIPPLAEGSVAEEDSKTIRQRGTHVPSKDVLTASRFEAGPATVGAAGSAAGS